MSTARERNTSTLSHKQKRFIFERVYVIYLHTIFVTYCLISIYHSHKWLLFGNMFKILLRFAFNDHAHCKLGAIFCHIPLEIG